jgi:toxin ParE1/3/4
MTARRADLSTKAQQDFEAAVDWYLSEAGEAVAIRFIDQFQATVGRIARNPNIGSSKFAVELGKPQLRSLGLGKFPYLLFYRVETDFVFVIRLLHGQVDIPQWLQGDA